MKTKSTGVAGEHFIEAKLDITVCAYTDKEEVSPEEANFLIKNAIGKFAESNDGSELIANATYQLVEE